METLREQAAALTEQEIGIQVAKRQLDQALAEHRDLTTQIGALIHDLTIKEATGSPFAVSLQREIKKLTSLAVAAYKTVLEKQEVYSEVWERKLKGNMIKLRQTA